MMTLSASAENGVWMTSHQPSHHASSTSGILKRADICRTGDIERVNCFIWSAIRSNSSHFIESKLFCVRNWLSKSVYAIRTSLSFVCSIFTWSFFSASWKKQKNL